MHLEQTHSQKIISQKKLTPTNDNHTLLNNTFTSKDKEFEYLTTNLVYDDVDKLSAHISTKKCNLNSTYAEMPLALFAIANKAYKCLNYLLNQGADPDALYDDTSLLTNAVCAHDLRAVKILLDFGAKMSNEFEKVSPLCCAISIGDEECLKLMIQYGVDLSTEDKNKKTPYMLAQKFNQTRISDILEKSGASTKEYMALKISCILDTPWLEHNSGYSQHASLRWLNSYFSEFIDQYSDATCKTKLKSVSQVFKHEFDFSERNNNLFGKLNLKLLEGNPIRVGVKLKDHYFASIVSQNLETGDLNIQMLDRASPPWNPKVLYDIDKISVGRQFNLKNKDGKPDYIRLQQFCVLSGKIIDSPEAFKEEFEKLFPDIRVFKWNSDEIYCNTRNKVQRWYSFNNTQYQSQPKMGICHFANQKSVLLQLMYQSFGTKEGYHLYKKFTNFMRLKALEELANAKPYTQEYVKTHLPGLGLQALKVKKKY